MKKPCMLMVTGFFHMSEAPEDIMVGRILRALEGPISVIVTDAENSSENESTIQYCIRVIFRFFVPYTTINLLSAPLLILPHAITAIGNLIVLMNADTIAKNRKRV